MSREPVTAVRTHLRIPVALSAGDLQTRFFDGIRRRRIFGNRCAGCARVYVPPRPFCAACWTRCEEWVELPDQGVVDTYVIVNVPFYGQQVAIPYVLAHVRLDGADVAFLHLVGERDGDGRVAPPPTMRSGIRVRAVWRDERTGFPTEDVDHFTPEP